MEISEYKKDDKVVVRINNPRNDNKLEWRDAVVKENRMVNPSFSERFTPYPMLHVEVMRTYCKATPNYKTLVGGVECYTDSTLEFFDKLSIELVHRSEDIILKV